jgi:hypothetical protein
MLGRRNGQRGLFEGDHLWLEHVGRYSFYGFLATHRHELFHDESFARPYSPTGGRPSVPPTLLATALLLQIHDRVSDEEARQRACFDARWKVALGLEMEDRPFATSTLRQFRVQLLRSEQAQRSFTRGLEFLRRRGFLGADNWLAPEAWEKLETEAYAGDPRVRPDASSVRASGGRRRRQRLPLTESGW